MVEQFLIKNGILRGSKSQKDYVKAKKICFNNWEIENNYSPDEIVKKIVEYLGM